MPDEAEEKSTEKAPAIQSGGGLAMRGGHAVVIAQPRPAAGGVGLPKVPRRKLVIGAFWTGMAAMLGGIVATTLNSVWPRGVTGFGGKIFAGTVDQIAPGEKLQVLEAKAWLVRLDAEQARVNGGQEGAILALYQKCPHLGCTVPWRPDFSFDDPRTGQRDQGWFRCPCHGSTYSDAGVRVFGPAPRSMDTFEITIENGNITIDTGAITDGAPNNASRGIVPG